MDRRLSLVMLGQSFNRQLSSSQGLCLDFRPLEDSFPETSGSFRQR